MGGVDMNENPFVIKCLSEECTIVHAGVSRYTASQLDDEIAKGENIPGSFGYKLKMAKQEVAML
jgi:hypothetical protein